jgi:hypothetical protein
VDEKLVEKGLSLVDQITEGLKAAAPQMVDVMLAAIQVQAIFWLSVGFTFLFLAVGGNWWLIKKVWPWLKKKHKESYDPTWSALGVGCHMVFTILFIPALINIINVTYWAAIVDPRLAIALRVLEKVM